MASYPSNASSPGRRQDLRAAAGGLVGTTIEWYDFFVYSTSAALILGEVFFPSGHETASRLAAFSTFFVAFAARPVGAVLFGHLGDRIGRRKVLLITLFLMGAATVSIGLLPGFGTWGVVSPLLLVVARVVQGISVGGEWGGAVLMSVEHAGEDRKSFLGSWPQWGSPIGLLLSTAVIAGATALPGDAYDRWGWRLPFLLSGLLFVVGLLIRTGVEESPEFEDAQRRGTTARVPLFELLSRHSGALLIMIGAFAYSLGGYYITTTFTISYLDSELDLARWVGLTGLVVAAICQLAGSVVGASVADRSAAHRRWVMCGSLAILVPFAFCFFPLVGTGVPALIWLAMGFSQFLQGAFYGPAAALVSQLLPPSVRYTGVSLGYQGSALVLGATAPFVATALVDLTGNAVLLTCYLSLMAIISVVSVASALRRVAEPSSTITT